MAKEVEGEERVREAGYIGHRRGTRAYYTRVGCHHHHHHRRHIQTLHTHIQNTTYKKEREKKNHRQDYPQVYLCCLTKYENTINGDTLAPL